MTTRYLPEIVYGLAIISLGTHTLWQREQVEEDRRHYTARMKLLEDVARRLRAGDAVPQGDFDTITKLANEYRNDGALARGVAPDGRIGWRETVLGRKNTEQKPSSDAPARSAIVFRLSNQKLMSAPA